MERTVQIQAPLPHIRSVNIWLLRGDPLTLIDTGPRSDAALTALEAGLAREGLRIEDIELVIPTHHHLDHTGLTATIVARSGARVAALDRTAEYGAHYLERSESRSLILARADAPSRGAGIRDPVERRVLGLHPRYVRGVRDGRGPLRRRPRHGGRARAADPGPPRPQHDRRAARRRAQRHRVRRRSPAGGHLVQRRDRPGGRADRIASAGADPVPGQSRADGIDAARAAADRSRRRGRRSPRAGAAPFCRTPAAVPAHPRRARGRTRPRVRDRQAPVVGAHGGRAALARRVGGARPPGPAPGRGHGLRAALRRRQPLRKGLVLAARAGRRPSRRRSRIEAVRDNSILYPGGHRRVELE